MPKKPDPAKQKAQRQKIFVIVGGVLLVVVFGYEAMTLGLIGGKKTPPPPVAVTTPAPTTAAPNSLTPPGLPGAPAATPAAAGQLADTDVPPATTDATSGELVSFSMFESKNPFAPQISQGSGSGGDSGTPVVPASGGDAGTTPADSPKADAPGTTTTPPATPANPGATVTPGSSGTTPTTPAVKPAAATPTVTISVNGKQEKVGKDGTFPSGSPVFRLVSFGDGTAEIGIVGGSYQGGGSTLTLERGHSVTLMNTSDGKKYTLELL
jgi:hypothetical protein